MSIRQYFIDIVTNAIGNIFVCLKTHLFPSLIKQLHPHFLSFHSGSQLNGCKIESRCPVFKSSHLRVNNIFLKIICGALCILMYACRLCRCLLICGCGKIRLILSTCRSSVVSNYFIRRNYIYCYELVNY